MQPCIVGAPIVPFLKNVCTAGVGIVGLLEWLDLSPSLLVCYGI